jgi:hypothetical protein
MPSPIARSSVPTGKSSNKVSRSVRDHGVDRRWSTGTPIDSDNPPGVNYTLEVAAGLRYRGLGSCCLDQVFHVLTSVEETLARTQEPSLCMGLQNLCEPMPL